MAQLSFASMARKPKARESGHHLHGTPVPAGGGREVRGMLQSQGAVEAVKPSKTARKEQARALQKLGEALLALRGDLLERLRLTDELTDALVQARRIHHFGARRRHLQLVGKLMRRLDEEQIASIHAALQAQAQGAPRRPAARHSV